MAWKLTCLAASVSGSDPQRGSPRTHVLGVTRVAARHAVVAEQEVEPFLELKVLEAAPSLAEADDGVLDALVIVVDGARVS